MHVSRSAIDGLLLFTPAPHPDERGMFTRTFDVAVAEQAGVDARVFRQDSLSRSRVGVVRGLHLRGGDGESKLVRCSWGAIFDVVVDLRPSSPTFGLWQSFDLDGEGQESIYVPAGCAHGFQALTDPADTSYRIDRDHDPSEDISISPLDPQLAIPWPLPMGVVSDRDSSAPTLSELGIQLPQRDPAG